MRGSVAAYFDATELRAADSKVRESHAQLRRLVDANIVGVGIANQQRIIVANDLYLDMLGYSRADLEQGRVDWIKMTAPESLERSVAAVQELHDRGFCTPFEKEYVRPDGTRIPVLLGCVNLTADPDPSWIFLAVDLSTQKNLERELQLANQRLTHSNDELQKFASLVTHDLRSPLRTVSMMTELLVKRLEGKLDGDCTQIAEHIQTTVVRMSSLIADLLEYSLVSSDDSTHTRFVDCSALVALTIRNLQTQIDETGARITADDLPMGQADDQLIRVFQNLIDNALKYRSELPPRTHVSAQRSGNEWVFSIKDNGIGFDMQYAEQIFGTFQRLHGSSKYAGSGIGLATCKKLVERYGGRLWAESEPGVGSVFYFTLPASDPKGED